MAVGAPGRDAPIPDHSETGGDLVYQMEGLVEHAPIETRVAWVRDLFERIDVDGTEQRAIAAWKAPTGQGVDRLESVTEWLRR